VKKRKNENHTMSLPQDKVLLELRGRKSRKGYYTKELGTGGGGGKTVRKGRGEKCTRAFIDILDVRTKPRKSASLSLLYQCKLRGLFWGERGELEHRGKECSFGGGTLL